MRETKLSHDGLTLRQITVNTAVVGTGAAGYNAADRLWSLGQTDLLLLTEARMAGTSRNTGSDKQTYYKLTLAGGEPDSVREMAQTLFDAGCVDGDLALAEAALSAQSFLRLAELGVPFPRNRWGEYVGYKTDHDPRRRATSVGPYTSRLMTEKLERAVQEKNIPFLDHVQVIRILRDDKRVRGLLCLDTAAESPAQRFLLICCRNVIYLRHRRPRRDLREQRLSAQPVRRERPGLRGRREWPQPHGVAVRHGLAPPALERLGQLYAGAPAPDFDCG